MYFLSSYAPPSSSFPLPSTSSHLCSYFLQNRPSLHSSSQITNSHTFWAFLPSRKPVPSLTWAGFVIFMEVIPSNFQDSFSSSYNPEIIILQEAWSGFLETEQHEDRSTCPRWSPAEASVWQSAGKTSRRTTVWGTALSDNEFAACLSY